MTSLFYQSMQIDFDIHLAKLNQKKFTSERIDQNFILCINIYKKKKTLKNKIKYAILYFRITVARLCLYGIFELCTMCMQTKYEFTKHFFEFRSVTIRTTTYIKENLYLPSFWSFFIIFYNIAILTIFNLECFILVVRIFFVCQHNLVYNSKYLF